MDEYGWEYDHFMPVSFWDDRKNEKVIARVNGDGINTVDGFVYFTDIYGVKYKVPVNRIMYVGEYAFRRICTWVPA